MDFRSDVTQLDIPKRLSLLLALKGADLTNCLDVMRFTAYKDRICWCLMGQCWYMAPNIFAFPLLVFWLPAFLLRLLSACPVCRCHCVCVWCDDSLCSLSDALHDRTVLLNLMGTCYPKSLDA